MFVKDYMTRHPIMIEPDKGLTVAQKLMTQNNIRHLPVVGDGKRLMGLITRSRLQIPPDRLASLDVWEITRLLSGITVEKVMVKGHDLHTTGPNEPLEDAAELMIKHKVGGLPVVEEELVVGILTETDLLIELRELLGANEPGLRVTVRVPDRPGEFSNLSKVIADQGWGIMAMGSVRTPKDSDTWDIILKVSGVSDQATLMTALAPLNSQEVLDVRDCGIPAAQGD